MRRSRRPVAVGARRSGAACRAGPRDWTSHGLNPDACRAIRTPAPEAIARQVFSLLSLTLSDAEEESCERNE